jgi:thiol-disulfide isomerase/thioredoxin
MRLILALLATLPLMAADPLIKINEAGYAKLIASQKGKVALVNFWATWCVPCRKEMPALAKMEGRLQAKGFRLITISADEPENAADAAAFLKSNGMQAPGHLKAPVNDDAFIKAIDTKWGGELPALFLYDKQGRIAKAWKGETATAVIEAEIRKLL